MARIKIEDLPPSRELTPEEMLELFGADVSKIARTTSPDSR